MLLIALNLFYMILRMTFTFNTGSTFLFVFVETAAFFAFLDSGWNLIRALNKFSGIVWMFKVCQCPRGRTQAVIICI